MRFPVPRSPDDCFLALWLGLLLCPLWAQAQTLTINDQVQNFASIASTTVTLTGRAELRITGTGDPLAGCVVHLNSPDSILLLTEILPSVVNSTFLGRLRVNGSPAVLDGNVRIVPYGHGAAVQPQGPSFTPLEIFAGRYFTGPSRFLNNYTAYDSASLGTYSSAIGSFKLKRGYMATFAQNAQGTTSRTFVAQDGDLEIGLLPSILQDDVKFVRVFPWRWTSKKGIAGSIPTMKPHWSYNWNLNENSSLDKEYVAIRQSRYWPGLDQDWSVRKINHLLGYNEPDNAIEANLSVSTALSAWPDLLATGLRVGTPAPTDGGRQWVYDFVSQADAAGQRVDFVAVHYYRSYWNAADPVGATTQFYNFLKEIHDQVKRPIWITEWNNGANWTTDPDPTAAQQDATVEKMIEMLDNTPFVERYALYNWVEDVRRVAWDDGWPTAAGVTYRDKVSPIGYRQELPEDDTDASARYSFDGHGQDLRGFGHNAMLVGAPVFTAGRFGQAISLDGTHDYVQLPMRLGDSTDFSFSGWIYWNGGGNWQRIFDFGAGTDAAMFLTPKSGGTTPALRFTINPGSGEQQLNHTAALPTGAWTHVAVTISGNTGKLFVNGALVNTNTSMTHNPISLGTKYNFLGKSQFAADPLFSGRLDEFRFSSSALTEAQVLAIYNNPPPQFSAQTIWKPNAMVGLAYADSLAGNVTGSSALTFSKMDGPAWLTVAGNGALTGTPAAADGGLNTTLVKVTDANGAMHTAMININVPLFTTTIDSSADDAEESAAGVVNLTSTDLELINDATEQTVGLRFRLPVPQGAVITSATIQFTTDEVTSAATTLNLGVQLADDAPAFAATNFNLSARPRSSTTVPWTPAAWNTLLEAGPSQRTPNLAGLVQSVVARPGWESGNAIVFLIKGSGQRTAEAFDKAGSTPPQLTVNYRSALPLAAIESSVASSANDAEQSAAGAVSLTSTDLELVNDGALGNQMVGLRFENIGVPRGATIASADLQFSADEAQEEVTNLTIRAQAADSAAVFTTAANDLSARPLTSAAVGWAPLPWANLDERGPFQQTPDLRTIVQEVMNRPGWNPGNSLALLIDGTGHRTADAADKLGGLPPTLRIRYYPELPLGSYARWTAGYPNLGAATADPDADGMNNLLECCFGLNPTKPDAMTTPLTAAGNTLSLTYNRASKITDLACTVEWCADPATGPWTSTGVTEQILSDNGTLQTRRATIPTGPGPHRFVRLKVTQM